MSPHELIRRATLDIEGRMPWSSNATFLCQLVLDDEVVGKAVYKPLIGERPLWDFEPGLYKREVAAYALSEATGLCLVPPTVVRDGPHGEGSAQWFVDVDHRQHYFTIYEQRSDLHDRLADFAFFDFLANNTDRKSGHVLIDGDDQLWGIDHGVCFSADFKLRTVIWEFGGEELPERLVNIAQAVANEPPAEVVALLSTDEVAALVERAEWLVEHPVFPTDPTGRRYPWPLV